MHKQLAGAESRPAPFRLRPRHDSPIPSPLMLCDRLITLAQEADSAGLMVTATHLLHLAHGVFDEGAPRLAA